MVDSVTIAAGALDHFAAMLYGPVRFMGAVVLRDSVFSPRDAFENVLPWPAASVQVTNGWRVAGDTLIPPSGLRSSATVATVTSGAATGSKPITLLEDLSRYKWHATWICAGPIANSSSTQPADTIQFDVYSNVFVYIGQPGYMAPQKVPATAIAQLFFTSGTMRVVRGTQVSITDLASPSYSGGYFPWDIARQRPDTLVLPASGSGTTPADTLSIRDTQSALPKFVGGSWCEASTYSVRTPMILEAY